MARKMQGSEVITQIKQRHNQIWVGTPWYGESIETILKDISFKKVLVRMNGSHNIAELVYHMTTWKKYVLRMMSDLKHSPVPEEENFPKIQTISAGEWDNLLQILFDMHQKMIDALSKDDICFSKPVDGSKFTIGEMIWGVSDHDLYHVGQLRLLSTYLKSYDDQT